MYNYGSYLCLSVYKDPAPPHSFSHTWLLSTHYVLENNLESPLGSKEIKPVNPKGNQGLMLKLKLQYFGHLMWRVNSLEKTLVLKRLKAKGEEGDRGWDGLMASLTQWTWVWVDSGSWWWTGRPGVLQFMGHRVGHDWETELNWTENHGSGFS